MATKQTFDEAFVKAATADETRTPDAIRKDIARQEYIMREAVRSTVELTGDARRRLKQPRTTKPIESLANPIMASVVTKEREHYNAAAAKLAELERELSVSEAARSIS